MEEAKTTLKLTKMNLEKVGEQHNASNSAASSTLEGDQKKKMDRLYLKTWEGNSDNEGSVDSAALDEDICYQCGLDTTDESNWSSLVICDICTGEYHLKCVNLDIVPRTNFICPRCTAEASELRKLKYEVAGRFEVRHSFIVIGLAN